MSIKPKLSILYNNWDKFLLGALLLIIILTNFQFQSFIIGNDNYSPELNPSLSVNRALTSPAWRGYRGLGVPSDSEQADIFRSLLEYALQFVLPLWAISQLYIFFALLVAGFGAGFLCQEIARLFNIDNKYQKIVFFFGGLLYCSNLITAWLFFSPLVPFLAGYAFLPYTLWSIGKIFDQFRLKYVFHFFIAIALLTTSSMVATTFIVVVFIVLYFVLFYAFLFSKKKTLIYSLEISIFIISMFFISQLFWIIPFIFYTLSNATALADSYINRLLTPSLIENEIKNNTVWNIPRFYFSWLHSINNNTGEYQVASRFWFVETFNGVALSFLPLVLAAFMMFVTILKKNFRNLIFFLVMLFAGWLFIKGTNPPLGEIYSYFQKNIPLFEQVLRWQSSKLYLLVLIPLTLLGSLGVAIIIKFIDSTQYINLRAKKYLHYFLIGFLTLLLFIYVHPFYQGDLIGARGHVKIPEEYMRLSEYLKKNYPSERIYLAPEANSLYFRSFEWGFFGSSFLNYLIPNPIIEKALVTGSYENETAQKVIEQSYYSQNPMLFTRALIHYKTPLILLDKSAAPLDNGYFYNWEDAKVSIIGNPLLQKIWSDGELSLYKLREVGQLIQNDEYIPIYANHNLDNLAPLVLSQQDNSNYYSDETQPGVIFPLALKFDTVNSSSTNLETSTKYHGPEASYTYTLSEDIISNGASNLKYDPTLNELIISPAIPTLEVNSKSITHELPTTKYQLKNEVTFISVGQDIYSIDQMINGVTVEGSYRDVGVSVRQWFGTIKKEVFQIQNTDKYPLHLEKDTVISWEFGLKSKNANYVSLCAYSNNLLTCLNKDKRTLYLKPDDTLSASLTSPVLLSSGDTVEFYMTPETSNSIEVLNITANIIDQSASLENGQEVSVPIDSKLSFELKDGDVIRYSIPKISGSNSYHFDSNEMFSPSISHKKECNRDIAQAFVRNENRGGLNFSTGNCEDYAEMRYQPLQTGQLGLNYYKGENTSGIPLRISTRDLKSERKLFDDQFEYKSKTDKLSLTLFPIVYKTYIMEFFNYSINPSTTSKTGVDDISFQFIPSAWYQVRLVPNNIDTMSTINSNRNGEILLPINQATHQNWTLSNVSYSKPVRINGWEKGWVVKLNEVQQTRVFFWPNILSWIGYVVMILAVVVVFGWFSLKKKEQNSA